MFNELLNAKLIEAYGNLDKICAQIYNKQYGISAYIEDMEYNGMQNNFQYKMLKAIRYKRNQLSHGDVPFDCYYATQEDIDFVNNFKDKIMRQEDPLAIERKLIVEMKKQKVDYGVSTSTIRNEIKPNTKKRTFWQWIKDLFS